MKSDFSVYFAIKALQPHAEFGVRNNDYDTLEWYDDPTVVPVPTREQVEAEVARQAAEEPLLECKEEAKKRIATTDWSVLPDVGLLNQSEFITYRAVLRGLITSPVVSPSWPIEPTPVWG